jgi:hypothetical protein
MTRSSNGVLHLIFQSHSSSPAHATGLETIPISPTGAVGSTVQALSDWDPGTPGITAEGGTTLAAFFGAISPDNVSTVFAITSGDGGATWSAPANVRDPSDAEAQSYAANASAAFTGGIPIIFLPHGDIVVQHGLPPTSSVQIGNDPGNGQTLNVDLAMNGSGQVAGGWQSLAGSGGDWMRVLAPALGAAQQVPGQIKPTLEVAAGSSNFYAPYTNDGKHVAVQRYGGSSLAVGSARGVSADKLGAASSAGGRIWVMWGAAGTNVAVTRSNMAVTRFEPIQRLKLNSLGLGRLSGDGLLGPLDLFADQIPNSKGPADPGTFYARVLPELSASAKLKKHKLTVTVSDAGDAVAGAVVKAAGKKATTNAKGVATLKLPAKVKSKPAISVTKTGYNALKI